MQEPPRRVATRGWRVGNPTWVGPVERDPLPHRAAASPTSVRTFVRSPERQDPAPGRRGGRCTGDRAAQRVGSGRVDPPRRAHVRAGDQVRDRAPHGRDERLLALPGGGDHARDPDLPRQVERLERHRLQLPRRPLRDGLRGPLRRNRPERRRGAHPRLQHRRGRRCRDRAPSGRPRSRPPPRRRSQKLLAWRLDLAHVDPLSSLTVVSGGSERYPAGVPVVLRAVSGHRDTGLTSCPGDLALRQARRDRRRDPGDRAAEALRAEGDGRPRRAGALPGARSPGR